jgi:hypothetical protein
LAGLLPLLAAAPGAAQTATNTWFSPGGGTWSDGGNWLQSAVPVSGPTTVLQFTFSGGVNPVGVAANDLGNPFDMNGFLLNSAATATSPFTIGNFSSNSLRMTGDNPFIKVVNSGDYTLNNTAAIVLAPSSGATTIGGTGNGNLTLSGLLSGTSDLTIARI